MVVYDGNNYKLLVKGADSSILPHLTNKFFHPYLEDTQTYLTKFSLLGYRTLVFGVRYMTHNEFVNLQKMYDKAMNSGNREEDLKKLANKVETNLTLLGCTAVEDALQLKVKETITRLLEADIKVWMITGDKLETAENIGLMAGIINHDMSTFYIKDVNKENFIRKALFLKEKVRSESEDIKKAVVFDMRSVGKSPQFFSYYHFPFFLIVNFFQISFFRTMMKTFRRLSILRSC